MVFCVRPGNDTTAEGRRTGRASGERPPLSRPVRLPLFVGAPGSLGNRVPVSSLRRRRWSRGDGEARKSKAQGT